MLLNITLSKLRWIHW